MNNKTFIIICCIFSLIIAIQSVIQVTHITFIVPNETNAYNLGNILGIAVRVLGSIVIAVYFMKRYFENRKPVS